MIKYRLPLILLVIFETVAVTLWLSKNNLFYLFNFSYIGISISLGVFLFIKEILLFQAHSTAACRGVYAGLSGTHLSENICRSKAFGIICLQVYLRRRLYIMLLQKYSDH